MKKTSMIRILVVLMIISVFATSSVYAATPNPPAKCIREILKEAVKYPDFNPKMAGTGDVEVVFTLSDQGAVQVKSVKCACPLLAEYVKETLSKVCCSNVVSPYNQHYKVTFKFRLS
jgi:hypothetical protein